MTIYDTHKPPHLAILLHILTMPSFHGVRVGLESQYDIKLVQEYVSPKQINQSSLKSSTASKQGEVASSAAVFSSNVSHVWQDKQEEHSLLPDKSALVEVQIPIYANSQFWLTYDIDPLLVPNSPEEVGARYIFFKLILPSHSTEHVDQTTITAIPRYTSSWGVGAKEDWKGKTMFGLFRGASNNFGGIDKRGFYFPTSNHDESSFDIQIFRARGRRRVSRQFPCPTSSAEESEGGDGVQMIKTGTVKGHHPQRYYQYALIDAVDAPFVTFRYCMRSQESLAEMGIGPVVLAKNMEGRVYCATEAEANRARRDHAERVRLSAQNDGHASDGESVFSMSGSDENAEEEILPSRPLHLSFPPSVRLVSTSSFTEPHSPTKDDKGRRPTDLPFIDDELEPLGHDDDENEPTDDDSVLYMPAAVIPRTVSSAEQYGSLVADTDAGDNRATTRHAGTSQPLEREDSSANSLAFLFGAAAPLSKHKEHKHGKTASVAAREKDQDTKDKEEMDNQVPSNTTESVSRRKGTGRFLMGVLESAMVRRRAATVSERERRGAAARDGDEDGERDGGDGRDREKRGGRYAAVRESF